MNNSIIITDCIGILILIVGVIIGSKYKRPEIAWKVTLLGVLVFTIGNLINILIGQL